jgi:sortase A
MKTRSAATALTGVVLLVCAVWLATTTGAAGRALATPSAPPTTIAPVTGAEPTAPASLDRPTLASPRVANTDVRARPLRVPVPAPLPADPYADDPDEPIGRIVIGAIGLDSRLGEGMTLTEINRGPAHWPGTAMPGGIGNVVVAGHRTTWSSPFRHLDLLEVGDEIRFSVGGRVAVYQVTETLVVAPEDVWIAQQGPSRIVTLFACHPLGSAAQRRVVR